MVRSFIDTNLLIYADASDDPVKQQRAAAVIAHCLRDGTGVVSTLVLHEFAHAALRKLGLPVATVRERLRVYARFETVGSSAASAVEALDIHAAHQLSYWDALVLQAARQSGCVQLLSEDLQTGKVIAGVRIVNPFLSASD